MKEERMQIKVYTLKLVDEFITKVSILFKLIKMGFCRTAAIITATPSIWPRHLCPITYTNN